MNCEQVQDSISGHADGSLSGILQQAIDNHLKRCKTCAEVLEQEKELVAQLKNSYVPAPREQFFSEALVRARQHHEGALLNQPMSRYFGTAACILLATLLILVLQGRDANEQPNNSLLANSGIELTVMGDEQLDIHLQLLANNDIEHATMVIEVPPSLQIVGYEEVQILEWPVVLRKGKNVLELPIKARQFYTRDRTGYLIARLKTQTRQTDFDIKVTIKPPHQDQRAGHDLDVLPDGKGRVIADILPSKQHQVG